MNWSAFARRLATPAHRRKVARFCFVSAALLLPGGYAVARWGLAIDPQAVRCLPEVRAVLIDRWQPPTARGDLVVFAAQGLEPAFADGTLLVKRLAGLPGDLVDVTAAGVRVNGRLVAEGLALASKLGHDPAAFTRHYRVPQGQFLALGSDPSSLDGRYYGPLPQDRIRGRARVLF
ncbi:MAG: signal peptidase I [Geminicoccaceae bacterium]